MRNGFRLVLLVMIFLVLLLLSSCGAEKSADAVDYSGSFVGYSWSGETKGTPLEDASSVIETILQIDSDGTIEQAKMRYWVKKDGYWITRQSGNARVSVDFSIDPAPAVPGKEYKAGRSMFDVYTADMMSFYAVAVNEDSTLALVLVDPITRYQMEMRFAAGFDFSRPVSSLTIGSGLMVPTIRTSGSGFLKPESWNDFADKTIFNIHPEYSHVVNDRGELAGLGIESSVKDLVEALGVSFSDGQPQPLEVNYGYFGLGGWSGNYTAIENFLKGKNAVQLKSLVNWSVPKFAKGINDKNQFGVETVSGATKTTQWSVDGISGATVRMSRESTSYQRALADAGIISEEEIVIGRF